MASRLFRSHRRASLTSLLHFFSSNPQSFSSISRLSQSILHPSQAIVPFNRWNPLWGFKNFSFGSVNLAITQGKIKFETHEIDPPKKNKWKTKKRLKMQRKREKDKRKSANKRDPRRIGVKGRKKKQKFPNAEARIKYKIEQAKIKEALLIERLKRYEVRKLQGPLVEPENLTGEERFYMKKMAQKRSNYVLVGRRGVFGGVILNMHLHWKKHETVKVICKPCKPGQVHEYAKEIARLSGGTPIQIIGDDTIIFYRGKDYVQPEVMSPIDTLSKKRALEKSKYEQSLESVRRFIAIAEKELELYYRHVALYGDPSNRNSDAAAISTIKGSVKPESHKMVETENDSFSTHHSEVEFDTTDQELLQTENDSEDEDLSGREADESLSGSEIDSKDGGTFNKRESLLSTLDSSSGVGSRWDFDCRDLRGDRFINLEG